jgi:hypothetical protein
MPARALPDGLALRVRVTARAAQDAIDGHTTTGGGAAVAVRVRALPADGAANAAVARVIADWLGVARRNVCVRSGASSRTKCLHVAGDPAVLAATVRALSAVKPRR